MSLSETKSCSVPGKVFLLGEYAVLAGQAALVASVGPRFRMTARDSVEALPEAGFVFHPQSPVARLLDWADREGGARPDLRFSDPFQGAGGFGASTAQFALAYRSLANERGWPTDWASVWKLYRELVRNGTDAFSPSGADLVAQWQGGVSLFHEMQVTDLWKNCDWSSLLVFSATGLAGRKVATHDHLGSLNPAEFPQVAKTWLSKIEEPLQKGIAAARSGDLPELGRAMERYADGLRDCGLEVPAAAEDRAAIRAIPGVLGVKGAGALQSDAVLVLIDPSRPGVREKVTALATRRGLKPVCDGLTYQTGILDEKE